MKNIIPIMFVINYLISYFIMSNIMIDRFDHINHNLNKMYMGLFMASLMGLTELWVMGRSMSSFLTYNMIFVVIVLVSVYAIREQTMISDNQYLRSMIEHHSSALLMSKKVLPKSRSREVMKMANEMIDSQSQEIDRMSHLLRTFSP